jgi:ABC-type nitrate/sulfonate/bicarbonate transport system permease component
MKPVNGLKAFHRWLKGHSGVYGVAFLLLLWVLLSSSGLIGKTLLASPTEVLHTVVRAFARDAQVSEKFHLHTLHTIYRALSGWTLSIVFGLMLGVAIGSLRAVYAGAEPVAEFVRSIPPILAFPLFLVGFNYGTPAYIWTIIFGCLPIMTLAVARGTLSISRDRIEVLKSFNVATPVRLFALAMEVLPSFFLGARITLSTALIIAVVTEMVFAPRSGLALGTLARDAEIDFNTPIFYACVLSIGAFGYLSNFLLRRLEQWIGFSGQLTDN